MVALLHPLAEVRRRRDREAHLDLAALELASDLEAGVPEDREHRGVLGEHDCEEPLDARLGRERRELLEESRGRPAALQLVGNREGDLCGGAVSQTSVFRERHDPLAAVLVGDGAEERASVGPVGLDEARHKRFVDP